MQNNKDYFDQSLDEIKLLKYVNAHDPTDAAGIVRLYDFFYYKVGEQNCTIEPVAVAGGQNFCLVHLTERQQHKTIHLQ
jgi:hypothetical protein